MHCFRRGLFLGGLMLAGLARVAATEPAPASVLITFSVNVFVWRDEVGNVGGRIDGSRVTLLGNSTTRLREAIASHWPEVEAEARVFVLHGDAASWADDDAMTVLYRGPGHCAEDTVVRFGATAVVFMGDLYRNREYPRIAFGNGGSFTDCIAAVEAVLAQIDAETVIVPGFGEPATREDLRAYRNMLRDTVAVVRGAREDGQALSDILSSGLLMPWAEWGRGAVSTAAWIRQIYFEGEVPVDEISGRH